MSRRSASLSSGSPEAHRLGTGFWRFQPGREGRDKPPANGDTKPSTPPISSRLHKRASIGTYQPMDG